MYKISADNSEEIHPSNTSIADLAFACIQEDWSIGYVHDYILTEFRFELKNFIHFNQYNFGDGSKLIVKEA